MENRFPNIDRSRTPAEILREDFSEEFVTHMKNRILVGSRKYGPVCFNIKRVKMIKSALKRIDIYLETGNTEFLVDAANLLMIEFMYPMHPRAHFRATDDDESPGVVGRHAGR